MTENTPNYPPIRRVVTGHDKNNVAKVMVDVPATNAKYPQAGMVSTMMWCTDNAPCSMPIGETFEDMGARIIGTAPPHKGTRFAVIDFPPGNHPGMHRTETIDYVIVMEGEIEMDMDDSTVKLKAGDIMIQRGTNHAWANRSATRARVAFVLVDAEPLGIGDPCSVLHTRVETIENRGEVVMLNSATWMGRTLLSATLGLLLAGGMATAQTYPNGSVKIIVPVPAGGVTDTMARIVAQRMAEAIGQNVIVDNRPGGNYSVGVLATARSPADGLTLVVVPDSPITANPHLFSKLSYDPIKDLTPIIALCRITPVLVINEQVPAKTVQELIALAKTKPGTLNYGSYGIGSYSHLSMEDFKQRTGTDIVHIPYRGAAPAANALLANTVSMLLLNLSSIEPHEKTGKVRIIAAAGDKRPKLRPDLPTIAETGVPGFSTTAWFALFGPPNMAPELVAKIHTDVTRILELPQTREFFQKNSFERVDATPEQFKTLIENDSRHWSALVQTVGVKID